MRLSSKTLIGRVHLQAVLEAGRDSRALYEMIDPELRGRRERESRAEPERTLAAIRLLLRRVHSAEVERVAVLEARKVCARHQGRPAALVCSAVRYNSECQAAERNRVWVRDRGVWYTTALEWPWGSA